MAKQSSLKKLLSMGLASALAVSGGQAFASGFQNAEWSGARIGNGLAGAGSIADDAATSFINPAGTVFLNKHQLVTSAIIVNGDFDTQHTNAGADIGGGAVLTGSDSEDAAVFAAIPAIHYVLPIGNRAAFGFSVTTPFGLKTEYSDNSLQRYFATKSKLITLDLNPTFAYKLTDTFAIGAGFSVQYADVELDKRTNLTALGVGGDFDTDLSANDISMGWNFGLMWQMLENTRVGLSYRSKVSHNLEGKARFTRAPAGAAAFGFVNRGASARLDLPETAIFSISQILGKFDVMFDVAYTRWRRFDKIRVNFDPVPGVALDVPVGGRIVEQGYHDTFRYSLGTNYHMNQNWTLRFGVVRDDSPVRNAKRTARLPDGSRWWVAAGVQYTTSSEALKFDLGYARVFFDDCDMKYREVDGLGNTLTMDVKAAKADLFAFQVTWNI